MLKFLRRKKQCIEDAVEFVQKIEDVTEEKLCLDVADDTSLDNSYRDSKCDYCNCALRDCSLCGTNSEG